MESNIHNTINKIIKENEFTSYVEIGYKDGRNFNKIHCDARIGIDENPTGDELEKELPYNSCYLRDDGSLLLKEDPKDFFARERDFDYDMIFLNGHEELAAEAADLLSSNGILVMNKCPEKLISSAYVTTLVGDLLITKRRDERVDIH